MADYTVVSEENGEVVAQGVQIENLEPTEALGVDLSTSDTESGNESKIPPILVKGALVAAGYAAFKGGKTAYRKIKEKIAQRSAEKEDNLTPEQLKVAKEAYLMMSKSGLSDTTILYEAECTSKMYSENKEEES